MDKPNGHHRPEATPEAIIAAGVSIPEHTLTLQRDPEAVIADAKRAAEALVRLIDAKPDKIVINDEIFLCYEDWQTLARFFNVTAAATSTRYVEFGDVVGFEASAEALLLIDDRTVRISAAEAMCLNDEWKWTDKPLFQLKSMAQTRACAKALRNLLAWVVVLAGYKPTPAEELDNERDQPVIAAPRRRSEPQREPAHAEPVREERPREREPYRSAPGQRPQQRYDHYHRGRDRRPAQPTRSSGRRDDRFISDKQLNRLLAIARQYRVSNADVQRFAAHYGFEELQDITRDYYDDIVDRVFKTGER